MLTPPRLRHAFAAAGLALAALLTTGGCGTTPTLPLPPPVVDSIGSPSLQGLVTVKGKANNEAWVTVLNNSTEIGKIGRADAVGQFEIEIEAEAGDHLDVFQEVDGIEGERTTVTVPAAP